MDLVLLTQAVFEADGVLARGVDHYQPRTGQIQMAAAVARTMQSGGMLVVEAGTGTGKTFAYLVPALLSGERVLISTATKALQDQLFVRDLPFLKSRLGVPVSVALLKGRSSYLCRHRLASARMDADIDSDYALQQLARVEMWAMQTRSGDLAEVDALEDNAAIIPAVTSTRENCLGSRCPQAATCYVNQARREAMAADVVVVNHHLFFADLNVRESGVAELLPSVTTVVFDEAHQLNETGVQFLGKQWSSGQMERFSTDLQKIAQAQARGFADWAGIAADLNGSAAGMRRLFHAAGISGKAAWNEAWDTLSGESAWIACVRSAQSAVQHAMHAIAQVEELSPEFRALQARAFQLLEQMDLFVQPVPPDSVRWIDVGQGVRLVQSPLDIAQSMQTRVLKSDAEHPSRKSWIFTSATLGADTTLSWFVDSCCLQGAEVVRVESPFNYAAQASLFVPSEFPKPNESHHSEAVAGLVAEAAGVLGGRTMVLTTTLRAMRTIADQLRLSFLGRDDVQVLVQGQHPKRVLIDMFCEQGNGARRSAGCVLVASVSFWEGIDIPGDALQLLVIDKLPFAPPDDPVQSAKAKSMEERGQSAFKQLHLPHAAVALKQGAGRLIRRETDQGVLVICDVRMATMGYGKQLVKALPPMQRLDSRQALMDKLYELTRPSTKAHPPSAHL